MTNTESATTAEFGGASAQLEQRSKDDDSTSHSGRWRLCLVVVTFVTTLAGALAVGFVTGMSLNEKKSTASNNMTKAPYIFNGTLFQGDAAPSPLVIGNSYIEFASLVYYKQGRVDVFSDDDDSSTSRRSAELDARRMQRRTSTVSNNVKSTTSNPWGTNSRFNGVDEADVVQSNGTHIFMAYGDEVVVVDATTMTISSRTTIPQIPLEPYSRFRQLLLIQNRLVVLDRQSFDARNTTVLVYNASTMTLETNETVQGFYETAYAIGTHVYVVTSLEITFDIFGEGSLGPAFIQSLTTTPLDENSYLERAREELKLQLGPFVDQVTKSLDCSGFFSLPVPLKNGSFADSNLVSISSFDVSSPRFQSTTSVLHLIGQGWHVVASEEYFVVASDFSVVDLNGSNETEGPSFDMQTYLVALKVQDTLIAAVSPGVVPGLIDVQFGIDIFKADGQDYIQVVSTTYDEYYDDGGYFDLVSPSFTLTVLKTTTEVGTEMPLVRQLSGLGKPGEATQSALLQGNRTFVASANNTGTLYTLDMWNLTIPYTMSELDVSGNTTYLLDLGRDLVLGLGEYNTTQQDYMKFGSFQLLLFNVSGQPRLIEQWHDDQPSGNATDSIAKTFDYKAVRYVADRQIVIVPMAISRFERVSCPDQSETDGSTDDTLTKLTEVVGNDTIITCYHTAPLFDGFRVFLVNATSGISEQFTIEQASNMYTGDCSLPSRSFVFGSNVVTTRGRSVLSYNLLTKTQTASAIQMENGSLSC